MTSITESWSDGECSIGPADMESGLAAVVTVVESLEELPATRHTALDPRLHTHALALPNISKTTILQTSFNRSQSPTCSTSPEFGKNICISSRRVIRTQAGDRGLAGARAERANWCPHRTQRRIWSPLRRKEWTAARGVELVKFSELEKFFTQVYSEYVVPP